MNGYNGPDDAMVNAANDGVTCRQERHRERLAEYEAALREVRPFAGMLGFAHSHKMQSIIDAALAAQDSGIHPSFGKWTRGELTDNEYADDLASRVDKATEQHPEGGE